MANVRLKNIYKSFDGLEVLHNLDLKVVDGEFVVLVGPSGCGKSTTLRLIAGLEEVTSGEIQINGRAVNDLEPRYRNIAMVFQNYALYPHKNVRENIVFGQKGLAHQESLLQSAWEKLQRPLGWRSCWIEGLLSFQEARDSVLPWAGPLFGTLMSFSLMSP